MTYDKNTDFIILLISSGIIELFKYWLFVNPNLTCEDIGKIGSNYVSYMAKLRLPLEIQ